MAAPYRPIAIVGAGCIVPGCGSPDALWRTVADGLDRITPAPPGDWRIGIDRVLARDPAPDTAWTDLGGYVGDLAVDIDPAADLDPVLADALDPVFRWTLHAAGQALAGVSRTAAERGGLVLGNLSYPTRLNSRLVERQWVEHALGRALGSDVHPLNRFMSGAPAQLAARAFGLGAGAFALDAACASGLYAIKAACDRLQDGRADLMLAGAVNAADQMYLHIGFTALNALSRSGRSRPFHREADGLIPAEGAAFVALKRLDDALEAGDRVLGVIRGVGLSNDGRSGGFLAPSQEGQMSAMRAALAQSGVAPEAIQYVECHATGTPVGDAVEIASMAAVYGAAPLALGSLKANLGHLITASGVAGLIKTLGAMEHGVLPPTPGARPLTDALTGLPFTVSDTAAAWDMRDGQRTAAVSGFGFGGNNAHLILDQHPQPARPTRKARQPLTKPGPMAVVGLAIRTHLDPDAAAFGRRVLGGQPAADFDPDVLVLGARQLSFPPAELKMALGQQLALMGVARDALEGVDYDAQRTGVFIGMQTDLRVSRNAVRIRWPDLMAEAGVDAEPGWMTQVAERASGPLESATVIGRMPNITANRLSNQLDLKGPGHAVSAEELSGDAALDLAITALWRGEVDTALVGAVELGREPLNAWACDAVRGAGQSPADAAVMLVLKTPERAAADGDQVLGLVSPGDSAAAPDIGNAPDLSPLAEVLGHAHAASGLLHVAAGLQMLASRTRLDGAGTAQPLLAKDGKAGLHVANRAFTGERMDWTLNAASEGAMLGLQVPILMRRYAAANRMALIEAVRADRRDGEGGCRLAVVGAAEQMPTLIQTALRGLEAQPDAEAWTLDGVSFRARPLAGEMAFAFTGAAAAYPGMGRGLMLGAPGLAGALAARLADAAEAADWIWRPGDPRGGLPFHQLAGSSYICQLHAVLSLEVLKLRPQASLGLSSGETNAVFAFGLWRDFGGLLRDVAESGLYDRALAGPFEAVREHWGLNANQPVTWDNLRVRAPAGAVKAAVAAEARTYLTIVNSPEDCVIGGDAAACQAVLRALGQPTAVPLGHDLAVHCEAVRPFEAAWRKAHTRETFAPPSGVRFYSNALGGVFTPDRDSIAEALTGQALRTVDFPMIVEQAWADGVRIFVEHGPRSSLAGAISETLAGREHLTVSLDRSGVPAEVQAWRAAAQLWSAGVSVDLDALSAAFPQAASPSAPAEPHLAFRLRPEAGDLPDLPPLPVTSSSGRRLPPAPRLALVGRPTILPPVPAFHAAAPQAPLSLPAPQLVRPAPSATAIPPEVIVAAHRRMTQSHTAYLQAQAQAMQAYGDTIARLQAALFGGAASAVPPIEAPTAPSAPPLTPVPVEPVEQAPPAAPVLPGPKFDRAQLEVLAGGVISSVFGSDFAGQDGYAVQVRMPEPPLLLCDRVLGIQGDAHSMGRGTIWTATDVREDSWYLHHGRMPPGVFIECGQADLLLISWLGVDAFNKGERAYRLLGCELVFNGDLPKPGDTLEYAIRIDGHASQGDVRLFFFNYDCHIGGERRISVRNGQAGFFTAEELANSSGVIWSPETAAYTPGGQVAPPPSPTAKERFSKAEVQAYLDGDLTACFGPGFYWADTHTRSPATPADHRNFLGEVTALEFNGGPAGRGYLRVEAEVRGDEWFFDGHFKNDPCMPGTLMADACLQAMAFYLAATGRTLHRDGWRFQPVRGEPYTFLCRGQVTPTSKRIVYELFVDEITDEDGLPTLRGHVLCTVDGRKAFLCERLALQLVPDWPLSSMPAVLAEADKPDARPLAHIGDFRLDQRSLINCAWGKPSEAFGPGFAHYDGPRRSPRLPGPPYHFMTRITDLHGEMAQMKAGGRVTALYDIPEDAWYFAENGAATMPNCVLMEVALQPCGWLASYTLRRLADEPELLFRNLDGDAVQHREVRPGDRTITTEVEMTALDKVGDLIIEKFAVRCTVDGEPLLDVQTVFGFFPPEAMANQKGFRTEPADLTRIGQAAGELIDLAPRPQRLFGASARLPDSKLLMIDRITGCWPDGGAKGLGLIRAEKTIVSTEWLFKAHFYQDPVQPGSLGIEAMLQAAQAFMLLEGMDEGLASPRFEPLAIGERAVWHYRGQVTPERDVVTVDFEIEERGRDAKGAFVLGRASLWVDGLQIYQAPRLGMRLVEGKNHEDPDRSAIDWRLDSDGDHAWVRDHRPTHTLPTLPFTYELEMMAQAAARLFPGRALARVESAEARQWVRFAENAVDGRTEAARTGPGLAEASLLPEGAGVAATGRFSFGPRPSAVDLPPLEPLEAAEPVADPYAAGALFHGPALCLMRDLRRGSNGAEALVDADLCVLPRGMLHPGLLDAALHCIPHDDPRAWAPGLPPELAGYPIRIEGLALYADLTADGPVEVHARCRGVEAERFLRTHLRLRRGGVWIAAFDLVEVLMPTGRLGAIPGRDRRGFLGEGLSVPGAALSHVGEAETRLERRACLDSDWLPGTLAAVYGLAADEDEARGVALRDHAAAHLRLHPSQVRIDADGVCRNLPLNPWTLAVQDNGKTVTVRSGLPGPLDWQALQAAWATRSGTRHSFVQDLGLALIQRFVRRVILADPQGFAALAGRPVLYLGNHQTGVESFLFLSTIVALTGLPAGAIAKREHRDSWVGKVHQLAEAQMGAANPLKLWLFDRSRPADLLRLLQEFGADLARRPSSLLVHTDGTRAVQGGAPVGAVSSVLIDLALANDLPIVPVRFAGGLSPDPAPDRLEFPLNAGQQDYLLGAAIEPHVLGALPFAQRSAFVMQRINALGPRGPDDRPLAGDPAFTAEVAGGRASGLDDMQAHLRAALKAYPGLGEQSLRLLSDVGDDPAELVRRLAAVLIGGNPAEATP